MTLDIAAPQGNRDRARTPLRWDDSPSGGFTAPDVTPWLPVSEAGAASVAGQQADRGSVLWLCRDLIRARRAEFGGQIARYQALPAPDGQWAYRAGVLTVVANFTDEPAVCAWPVGEVLLSSAGAGPDPGAAAGPRATLGPWEGIIVRQPDGPGRS
jgi:alpha-glucosidase